MAPARATSSESADTAVCARTWLLTRAGLTSWIRSSVRGRSVVVAACWTAAKTLFRSLSVATQSFFAAVHPELETTLRASVSGSVESSRTLANALLRRLLSMLRRRRHRRRRRQRATAIVFEHVHVYVCEPSRWATLRRAVCEASSTSSTRRSQYRVALPMVLRVGSSVAGNLSLLSPA